MTRNLRTTILIFRCRWMRCSLLMFCMALARHCMVLMRWVAWWIFLQPFLKLRRSGYAAEWEALVKMSRRSQDCSSAGGGRKGIQPAEIFLLVFALPAP